MDVQKLLTNLSTINASPGKIKAMLSDLETLNQRLIETRGATVKLPRAAPDFEERLAKIAQTESALQRQVEQAEAALEAEVGRVEAEAVKCDESAGQYRARLKAAQVDILQTLVLVQRKILAYKRLAGEHEDGNGILSTLAKDAGIPYNAVKPLNCWHVAILPNDREECAAWFKRYAEKSLRAGVIPDDPDELLAWFGARY